MIRKFCKDTRGQDLIEYALMAFFVAVGALVFMPGLEGLATKASTSESLAGVPMAVQTVHQYDGPDSWVRIACAVLAVLAVVVLGAIILRRRKNADE